MAVAALTAFAFAETLPQQQAFAGGYHDHNHNHHNNGLKVDQQINQANFCDNGAQCINDAQNNFGPQQPQAVWK